MSEMTPAEVRGVPPVDEGNRVLGVVGLVLVVFPLTTLVGFVLSIIALVRSRKAGSSNGFARAGVILGAMGMTIAIVLLTIGISGAVSLFQTCQELGPGVHEIGNATYTCTPTSADVQYH